MCRQGEQGFSRTLNAHIGKAEGSPLTKGPSGARRQLEPRRRLAVGGCDVGKIVTGKDRRRAKAEALADVLNVFKSNKINLSWIESFPYREVKGQYVFFVDFEGHRDDQKIKKALAALEAICDSITVLGSFPFAQVSGD